MKWSVFYSYLCSGEILRNIGILKGFWWLCSGKFSGYVVLY